jgi:hypothetical protein
VVQDVVEVQVGVDQPMGGRLPAEGGQDGLDAFGCLAEDMPHGRVRGCRAGRSACQVPAPVRCWMFTAGRVKPGGRRNPWAWRVQRSQDTAEVGDQPPGRAASARAALDPAERYAAAAGRKLRGGRAGAESGGRDGQAGVAGQGGQPGQFGVEFAVASSAGQAHPDDQALTRGRVTAE